MAGPVFSFGDVNIELISVMMSIFLIEKTGIFGANVDMFLDSNDSNKQFTAEQIYYLYKTGGRRDGCKQKA